MEIVPLPKAPKERSRIGEELQPISTYAGIIPYLGTIQDVEVLQEHEKADPEFESKDWWWDHQRIRFLNGKLGDRKSTRLNSSHVRISYAVFCLKKKRKPTRS